VLDANWLAAGGFTIGSFTIPWSVLLLILAVVVGLFLIRAAVTLVKVLIVVGIGVGIYLLVQYALNNFS
jgi:uncharacterized membrane protein YczE